MLFINEIIFFVQILNIIICSLYFFFDVKSLAINFIALIAAFISDSFPFVDIFSNSLNVKVCVVDSGEAVCIRSEILHLCLVAVDHLVALVCYLVGHILIKNIYLTVYFLKC